jgi:hypothetical protein
MQTSAIAAPLPRTSILEGVTPYHWLVVIIASCGWLFDCMDQRLFILGRESALKELLRGPAGWPQSRHPSVCDHVDDRWPRALTLG